jgi:hypothetical protein
MMMMMCCWDHFVGVGASESVVAISFQSWELVRWG